ncbi:hypothetical protein ACFOZ7_10030 [Natribaculum luteum]|uniref:Uncharacterized protein n=1 Tax=Natribaculum luteum TaxID=1586232 RepID=A0ABD5NZA0_9EURY|nr:hypothetical protein [Natribaculum luteum]
MDRLRNLTPPAVEDVRDGLETMARADELEEEIEATDALIDEIISELDCLIDEEIEIVEEAVGEYPLFTRVPSREAAIERLSHRRCRTLIRSIQVNHMAGQLLTSLNPIRSVVQGVEDVCSRLNNQP